MCIHRRPQGQGRIRAFRLLSLTIGVYAAAPPGVCPFPAPLRFFLCAFLQGSPLGFLGWSLPQTLFALGSAGPPPASLPAGNGGIPL